MPPKGKYAKKGAKRYKKKNGNSYERNKSKLGRPSAGLTTSRYKFKRQMRIEFNIGDGPAGLPTGWTACTDTNACIYKHWRFNAASDITAWSEFQQLFELYKIDAVRIQLYPDLNTITSERVSPQMMLITVPTRAGWVPSSLAALQNHQALKKKIVFQQNQPLDLYMKMNQLSAVYSTSTTTPQYTDYVQTKPKFIATQEDEAQHYGFATYLLSVNNTSLVSMSHPIAFTLWQTVYFTCKGVA